MNKAIVMLAIVWPFVLVSDNAQGGEEPWQSKLRAELHSEVDGPRVQFEASFYATGKNHYILTVRAEAAKILESHPPSELLPFLAKLREERYPPGTNSLDAAVASMFDGPAAHTVDQWIKVVRMEHRGKPLVRASGAGATNLWATALTPIPVFEYRCTLPETGQNKP